MDCQMCISQGEPTPDRRKRGGFMFGHDGSVVYRCFRCGFTTGAGPSNGFNIGKKMGQLLSAIGFSGMDIGKMRLHYLPIANTYSRDYESTKSTINYDTETELPSGSKSFQNWIEQDIEDDNFYSVVSYIHNRFPLFNPRDFYWTPNKDVMNRRMNNRAIVPFYFNEKVVGWTARLIDDNGTRYISEQPADFIYNSEALYKPNRKYAIITEGIFDSMWIDAAAILKNNISNKQAEIINHSEKEIIVLPDRGKGKSIAEAGIRNGWYVSVPSWEENVKDAGDAVQKYGRLYTIRSIIDSRLSNELEIEIKLKDFYK